LSKTPEERISRRLVAVCFVIVVALIALDLWSKSAVFAWLEGGSAELVYDRHGHERVPLIGDWLTFMTNRNYGAAFGQLDQIPYVLVSGRIIAALVLAWLIVRAPRGQRVYLTSLVLILSGALGNLYDNLFKPLTPAPDKVFGPVRDFIDVYFYVEAWNLDWHFPTFNVADSCITVGACLLLVSGFFGGSKDKAEATDSKPGGADDAEVAQDG